eukprot:7295581-Pyramimonas_sp.AAC.1
MPLAAPQCIDGATNAFHLILETGFGTASRLAFVRASQRAGSATLASRLDFDMLDLAFRSFWWP